jgi:hypothetical protein
MLKLYMKVYDRFSLWKVPVSLGEIVKVRAKAEINTTISPMRNRILGYFKSPMYFSAELIE